MTRNAALAVLAAALMAACSNAGENRILSISSTGIVKGVVYFDKDGDRTLSIGDDSVKNIRVRLINLGGNDTVSSALTAVSGQYRMSGVPVGTYKVSLDTTSLVDTAVIAQLDSAQITVLPGDSTVVVIGVGYPHVSIKTARTTVPLGHRVFVEGIVLNAATGPNSFFIDTTVNIQDTSAAIRLTRLLATTANVADSVRVRGTVSTRSGQRTLDVVSTFVIAPSFLPTATTVMAAQAQTAKNGTLDAQQVQILLATVADTSRDPAGGYHMTMSDSSGTVDVFLDLNPFPLSSLPPTPSSPYIPGNKFKIIGLLEPTGAPGVWRVQPRSQSELLKLP